MRLSLLRASARAFAVLLLSAGIANADPVATKITKTPDGGFELQRAGQPYFILGAGGDASKELLKDSGGNSFRTWGADDSMHRRAIVSFRNFDTKDIVRPDWWRPSGRVPLISEHLGPMCWGCFNEQAAITYPSGMSLGASCAAFESPGNVIVTTFGAEMIGPP